MQSTASLINTLAADHPDLTFTAGSEYRWSPQEATIYYDTPSENAASLLHELAHAVLGHTTYERDISLIAMERDAWEHARTILAPRYQLTIDDDTIQEALDTYRDWLHARSRCPACGATGRQSEKYGYTCIACRATWRVNDARMCALRRYRRS